MPQENLAVELVRKLLNNEIRIRSKQSEVGGQRSNVRFGTSPRPSLHSPADTSSAFGHLSPHRMRRRESRRRGRQAKLRVTVKRILRKHGYPPDKQEKAAQTVLQQAELLCADGLS